MNEMRKNEKKIKIKIQKKYFSHKCLVQCDSYLVADRIKSYLSAERRNRQNILALELLLFLFWGTRANYDFSCNYVQFNVYCVFGMCHTNMGTLSIGCKYIEHQTNQMYVWNVFFLQLRNTALYFNLHF